MKNCIMGQTIEFKGFYHKEANALCDEDKRWVYGFLFINEAGYWIKNDRHSYLVDPKSVGQYIGHKYKDGEKIYSGDIINRKKKRPCCAEIYYDMDFVIIYVIEHTGFVCKELDGSFGLGWDGIDEEEVIKIGTLYENPESLERYYEKLLK